MVHAIVLGALKLMLAAAPTPSPPPAAHAPLLSGHTSVPVWFVPPSCFVGPPLPLSPVILSSSGHGTPRSRWLLSLPPTPPSKDLVVLEPLAHTTTQMARILLTHEGPLGTQRGHTEVVCPNLSHLVSHIFIAFPSAYY